MTEQRKTGNPEFHASQTQAERNAADRERHTIAGAALAEAANREVAQANAIDARMKHDQNSVVANEIAIERHASAKRAAGLRWLAALLVLLLVGGAICYYYLGGQSAASGARTNRSNGVTSGRP